MGGGPSREERAQTAALQRQQQQALETQNRLMTQAETPDPLAERLRAQRMSWLDATEGRNGPVDVTKLEGMAPYLDLYNRGRAKREGERQGIGVLQMGVNASNPDLAARIAEQRGAEREQEAAGAFSNAYNMKDAEMRGSIMPLLGLQQNRDLGLAGLSSSNYNNATDQYLRLLTRPRQPSMWGSILGGALNAGGMIGAAAI